MYNFDQRMGTAVSNAGKEGWLVSILELGAWFGVLCTGYLADKLSRKYTIVFGELLFCIDDNQLLTEAQLCVFSASALLCSPLPSRRRRSTEVGSSRVSVSAR